MKSYLFIFLFLLIKNISAQNYNLIPNSSFEFTPFLQIVQIDYSDTIFENNYCWRKISEWCGGYYYSNINEQNIAILNGPQEYRSFKNEKFISLISYVPRYRIDPLPKVFVDSIREQRAYMQCKLNQKLVAGTTYYFSINVGGSNFKNDTIHWNTYCYNIGAYFSENAGNYVPNYKPMYLPAQINFNNFSFPLNDTFAYQKLSGSFVSNGDEQYLTIGNFDYVKDLNLYFTKAKMADSICLYFSDIAFDDLTLTADTTTPLISLDYFWLGNDTTICDGQTLTLGGEPNFFSYKWSNGDSTRFSAITNPGTYWCTVDYGCGTYTDTIVVSNTTNQFNITDTSICIGQNIKISSPISVINPLWSNGSMSSWFETNQIGTYWLMGQNYCGAFYTDTFRITSLDSVLQKPNLGADTNLCINNSMFSISLQDKQPSYFTTQNLWSTGDIAKQILVDVPNIYWIKTFNNCYSTSDTITIGGCPPTAISSFPLPNAFSPNGDGVNDVFKIPYPKEYIYNMLMIIYDRWGNKRWFTTNKNDGWDGKNNDVGTYFYYIQFTDITGKMHELKGDVTLVK